MHAFLLKLIHASASSPSTLTVHGLKIINSGPLSRASCLAAGRFEGQRSWFMHTSAPPLRLSSFSIEYASLIIKLLHFLVLHVRLVSKQLHSGYSVPMCRSLRLYAFVRSSSSTLFPPHAKYWHITISADAVAIVDSEIPNRVYEDYACFPAIVGIHRARTVDYGDSVLPRASPRTRTYRHSSPKAAG